MIKLEDELCKQDELTDELDELLSWRIVGSVG